MNATTIERVKRLLPGAASSTEEDAMIDMVIASVSANVEAFLRRPLETKSRTEDVDVRNWQRRFFLQAAPVSASPALAAYNDWGRTYAAATLVDATLYHLDLERGSLTFDKTYLVTGIRAMRFVYTGGMGTTVETLATAFPSVVMAATYQVAHEFRRRKRLDLTSLSVGGESIAVASELRLLEHVKDLLQPYRREGFIR